MERSSLRTLQIVNVRWFNATAWYGIKLAQLLNQAGHETRVLALANTDTFAKAEAFGLSPLALPLNETNPLRIPALLGQMQALIHDFKPHVVNCHRGESFLFWGALKALGRYALIRTRGDQRLPKGNLPNRLLHTQLADAVIATNSVMTQHFATRMGVPSARLHTIFGGVDTNVFRFDAQGRERVRAQYGFTPEHCVLGLLGRFDRVKGQKELIFAAAQLVEQGLPVRLLLAGFPTATSQETVESWIREAGMTEHTTITGRVPDVPACLAAMDIGVVASLWSETIARAALELMACERPLISTSVGVMPDLLPEEALVPPNDIPSLTKRLQQAVVDKAFQARLTNHNRERMATLRDEDFLEQTLQVYRQALAKRS